MLRLTIDSTGVFYSLERVDLVRSDLASLRDLHAVDGGRVAEAVLQLHPTLYNALNGTSLDFKIRCYELKKA